MAAEAAKTLGALSCADDYDPNSLPVDKARELIRQFLNPITGVERVAIRGALGRVLGEDVISPVAVPSHDNSAMDGYALRHEDLAADADTPLEIAGTAFAGAPFPGPVEPGRCVRIMTGGVLPQGADTVVMQERVVSDGKTARIAPGQKKGQNIRRAGEDLRPGQVVLARGTAVRPAELGLIASLGIGEVTVYRRLRAAFFSTGDELVSIGTPLAEGQIYDSNRYTIHGMLTRLGCEVFDLGVVRDDPAALEKAFHDAAAMADVVITSGGVSVGEADFTKDLMDKLGEVVFWKIAMKPGRPLAYGRVGNAHFFGLPGNPVSVMVTFYEFVRDALLVLMGRDPVAPLPTFRVKCTTPLKKAPGRTEFQRGVLYRENGEWAVRVTGDQGSGILRSMAEANCFIVLPTEQGSLPAGATVEVQLLDGLV
jgi:molybdopterin molybdotransferase